MYDFNTIKYVCFIVEHIARTRKLHNREVAEAIGTAELDRTFEFADVLHCENKDTVADRLVEQCNIPYGDFDVRDIKDPTTYIPTTVQMGKVHARLFQDVFPEGGGAELIQMYNNPICSMLDTYDIGAYYEPRAGIAEAFRGGTGYFLS